MYNFGFGKTSKSNNPKSSSPLKEVFSLEKITNIGGLNWNHIP